MIFDPMYMVYGAAAIVVLLVLWIIRLEIRIHRLLIGKNARSLEDSIVEAHRALEKFATFERHAVDYFEDIERRLGRSISAVETIRFNPFKGTGDGGNQSFSTSFVSENGDGVVISSLYSRDRISIFSKPLKSFESTFELTEEEQDVVTKAKNGLSL